MQRVRGNLGTMEKVKKKRGSRLMGDQEEDLKKGEIG